MTQAERVEWTRMYATSLHVDGEDAVVGTPGANVSGGSSAGMDEDEAGATESSVSVSAPATTLEEVVPGTPERLHPSSPPAAHTPPRPSVRITDEMAWFVSNVLPELEARSTESRASFHRPSSPPGRPVRRGGPPARARATESPSPRPIPSRRSTALDARFETMLARVPPQPPVAAERSRARVEMEHLAATVESMGRELAALRALVETSVEMQFETQRAVRQELAAALARRRDDASRAPDASLDVADAVEAAVAAAARLTVSGGSSENDRRVEAIEAGFEHARDPPNAGACVCCMEAPANALFYRCGHLCCCAACATKLHHGPARSRLCPCCRAPIVEVIRAYGASEGTGAPGTAAETAGTAGTGTRGKSEDGANVVA